MSQSSDGPTRREPQAFEVRFEQIKAQLHEEWRLKAQGIHHDHLSDLSVLITEVEFLQSQLEQRDAQLASLQTSIEGIEKARDFYCKLHKTAEASAETAEAALKETTELWNSALTRLANVKMKKDARIAELLDQLQTTLREREEAVALRQRWAKDADDAQAALAAVRQQLEQHQRDYRTQNDRIAELNDELLALRQQLGQAEVQSGLDRWFVERPAGQGMLHVSGPLPKAEAEAMCKEWQENGWPTAYIWQHPKDMLAEKEQP